MKKFKAILYTGISLIVAAASLTTAFSAKKFIYYKIGDFDTNKVVNVSDITTLQMQLSGYNVMHSDTLNMADFNGDGTFDVIDVTETQKMLAGITYDCFVNTNEEYKNITIETRSFDKVSSNFIDFENIIYENNLIFTNFEASESSKKHLIKSKNEFYSVFGVYSPIFDDEFFNENALYVGLEYDSYYGKTYEITYVGVEDNKLMIDYEVSIPQTVPPMSACWHMFYKVNKADVENIDTISVHTSLVFKDY